MANCRVCFAPITWATNSTNNENVPLDDHEERDQGPGRFRVIQDGQKPIVEPVLEVSPLRTFVDHRLICQQPRAI